MKNKEENKIKYNTLRIIRQLPREGELWRTEGGTTMADKKSPCAAGEGQSRDETTVFVEDDPLCAALDELCATLNDWYGTMHNPWQREDREYRKMLAENLRSKLREIIADEPGKES